MAKDYQAALAKKRYKKPNWLMYFIYYVVDRTKLLGKKYNPVITRIDDIGKCKGGAFLIWNHQSRRDHTLLTLAAWPRKINIVCEYNEFFRKHLYFALRAANILPKRQYTGDVGGIRAIRDIIQKGGIVALSPEGNSSVAGDQMPIVPGTGRFLQAFNVPVYMAYFQGSYLTNNKVDDKDRIGKIFCQTKLLFTPEQLRSMKSDEIDAKINEEFRQDDYAWNKIARIKYAGGNHMTDGLCDINYKCPRCGAELQMECKDSYIKCKCCGNGATMDEYYDFHKFDDTCVIPVSPSEWAHWERQTVIDAIRKDPNFELKVHCKLGYLPKGELIPKEAVSKICGEGDFIVDHKGVHFRGTKLGEEFNWDKTYNEIYTFPNALDLRNFTIYNGDDYYDYEPVEAHESYKILLHVEEMHRLHINRYKNHPWFDYMYEGKELGIDLKK